MLDLTDPTRPAGLTPGRHLPTLVFYPAVGPGNGAETGGAPGLSHGWPLVVFAEGYAVTPLTYHDLIHHLAASGFVVAAPAFPLETQGGPLDEGDLHNEPADIKFVITQALAASSRPGVLAGMIDPAHVALVGHSDGGEAVLGTIYLPGIADARVGPVVAMAASGSLVGSNMPATPRHDLMVIEGTADTVNPPPDAGHLYAAAPAPKAYVQLLGASHLPPFTDANQWRSVVESTIVDWFDAWFGGLYGGSAAGRLGQDGNVKGVAQIQLG
jgi:alpha-beta hydrolase superfamily lysophospholipase